MSENNEKNIESKKMDSLEQTLKELGIKGIPSLRIKTRLRSDAIREENERLYREVNEKYLPSIIKERNPGECIHVTGEMRALADRVHRSVCRKMRKKYNNRFTMVCYLSSMKKYFRQISKHKGRNDTPYVTIGGEILKWMRQNWRNLNLLWADYLDVFDLLGDAEVNLYALRKYEKIHFSVFADKYTLLQAKHPTGTHTKEVWLLESRPLFEILSSRSKKIISRAEYVHPRIFKELMLSISSSSALHILFLLYDNKKMMKEELCRQLGDLKAFQDLYVNLEAAGFIEDVGDFSQITEQGEEYFKLFL